MLGDLVDVSKLLKMYVGLRPNSPYNDCGTFDQLVEKVRTHLERMDELPEGFNSVSEAMPNLPGQLGQTL